MRLARKTKKHCATKVNSPLLRAIVQRCVKYCIPELQGDCGNQKKLIGDLNRLPMKIELKIEQWKWLVRSNAINERKQSYSQLAANNS